MLPTFVPQVDHIRWRASPVTTKRVIQHPWCSPKDASWSSWLCPVTERWGLWKFGLLSSV